MNSHARHVFVAAGLLALPLFTGCQHSGQTRTITEADNGTTVTLSHHDQLEVVLPGNPTTGHSWQTVLINPWVLAPLGRPVFTSNATSTNGAPPIGAAGNFRMTYTAVGRGISPLELLYSRPWEPSTTDSKRQFKVTVNVSR